MQKILSGELIIGILLILFGSFTFYQAGVYHTQTDGVGPTFFPQVLSAVLILFSLVSIVLSLVKSCSPQELAESCSESTETTKPAFRKIVLCIAGLIVYWAVMYFLGYIGPSIAFLVFMMLLLGERNVLKIACWSIGLPLLLYLVFERILNVPLPVFELRI
ncbi:MAG: tripartite tricarboxylate transporter TctB family protein [Candidatus Omnitrophota bacterium]|jgi:uncharacterized membrane protein YidH (DUF202 family)|nr:MAG: tripartite tricarboxylate transporter TctB family protein [Candidatus Omnitrophota bacterium]